MDREACSMRTGQIWVFTAGDCWEAMVLLTIAACPHCGSPELISSEVVRLGYPPEKWPYAVHCGGCGAVGPWAKDEEAAVRIWNRLSGTDTDHGRRIEHATQHPLPYADPNEIPF